MIVSQGQNMSRGGYREGSGGKPKWIHGKTKTIRVPEVLADQILDYARKIDKGEDASRVASSLEATLEAKVINLTGVSLKSIDGQMGVKLSDLIKKGYSLIPDHLQQITVNALKNTTRK